MPLPNQRECPIASWNAVGDKIHYAAFCKGSNCDLKASPKRLFSALTQHSHYKGDG